MELTDIEKSYIERLLETTEMYEAVKKALWKEIINYKDVIENVADQRVQRSNIELGEMIRAYGMGRDMVEDAFKGMEKYKKVKEAVPKENDAV